MAKQTVARIEQDLQLGNKGIEIHVWEGGLKGGRLLVTKARVKWFPPNAKKPAWQGTWEKLDQTLVR